MTPVFMEKTEIRELIEVLKLSQFYLDWYQDRCEREEVTEQIDKLQRTLEPCPFNGIHKGILWCAPCNYRSPKWKAI